MHLARQGVLRLGRGRNAILKHFAHAGAFTLVGLTIRISVGFPPLPCRRQRRWSSTGQVHSEVSTCGAH